LPITRQAAACGGHSADPYVSAEAFLAEGGHTPIVFITAHDDPEARAEAEALGCTDYFRKTDFGAEVLEAHLIERSVEGHQHKSN